MPSVRKVAPPPGSALADWYDGAALLDSYAVRLPRGRAAGMRALAEAALATPPAWANALMRLRDGIVRPLGLKTSQSIRRERQARGHVHFFPVIAEHADEILLGEDDRHLDFRASLLRRSDSDGVEVVMTTSVRVHNALGRAYLTAITPFHVLIVRSALARLAAADPA